MINKIAVGGRHNLILCNDGNVYSFGDNSQNQCSGYNTCYRTPTLINKYSGSNAIDIFAGYNFSVSYSDLENIWSWGDNSNYKCGTDMNIKGTANPTNSNDLIGLNVGNIYTGINHMIIALTDDQNTLKRKNIK